MAVARISKWTPILCPEFRTFFNLFLVNDAKLMQAEDLDGVEHVARCGGQCAVAVALFEHVPQILLALRTQRCEAMSLNYF